MEDYIMLDGFKDPTAKPKTVSVYQPPAQTSAYESQWRDLEQ
jgi:hypothetical protein